MKTYINKVYQNPANVYLDSLNSAVSIRNCQFVIRNMCKKLGGEKIETFNWSQLDYTEFLRLKHLLIDTGILPTSINHYLTILKGVMREAWRLGQIDIEEYMKIKDIQRVKGSSTPKGRALSTTEINTLVNYRIDENLAEDVRDSAIIALLYGGGLRRQEVTTINTDDYNGQSITVNGKGNKKLPVYLPAFACNKLDKWLALRGGEYEMLFNHVRNKGYIFNKRLSPRTIGDIINRRCKNAGVNSFTPHDLRRSFATNLIDNNVDLFTVQKLMRHADIETTRRYDLRDTKTQIEAVERLPF